uniref:Uncharacterized protein n=1 Tax=Romanomermis culicivorax TaxID=13658 RepID=A0A915K467_ROMCU
MTFVLLKLKNAFLEWAHYLLTLCRFFKRSRKKNLEQENLVDVNNLRSVVSYQKTVTSINNGLNNVGKEDKNINTQSDTLENDHIRIGFKNGPDINTFSNNNKLMKKCVPKMGMKSNKLRDSSTIDHQRLQNSANNGSGAAYISEILINCDIEKIVRAPSHVDQKEWIASHLLAFFHHVNALYGSISEFCCPENCPIMNGNNNQQILWIDDRGRKFKYSAQQYIDCVMSFINKLIDSEETFPTKFGLTFPQQFDQTVKKIFGLLHNVLNHMNYRHLSNFELIGLGTQIRALNRHFGSFAITYGFIDDQFLVKNLTVHCRASVDQTIAQTGET